MQAVEQLSDGEGKQLIQIQTISIIIQAQAKRIRAAQEPRWAFYRDVLVKR